MSGEDPVDHDLDFASILASFADRLEGTLDDDQGAWDRNSDESMLDYAEEELDVKLRSVPVVGAIYLRVIQKARRREQIRVVIKGPRSGGKTQLASTIQIVLWRFFGYDSQNVGGSLEQARQCYDYIGNARLTSVDVGDWMTARTQRGTIGRNGGRIRVCPASVKAVRGPHPRGPEGGGLVFLDEVAVMEDKIVDAAKLQLGSAKPSAIIQASTMGEQQVGRYWDLLQDVAGHGYEAMAWDKFDVAERCEYDCETTCPIRDHFFGNHEEGESPGFYRALGGRARELVHKAYCGGKAHDVDGWVPVDEIAQEWRENPREVFERENMGWAAGRVGHVFDPQLLDAATVPGFWLSKDRNLDVHEDRLRRVEKRIGLDWGWAGMAAAAYVLRAGRRLVVYRWEVWDHVQFRRIREHLLDVAFEEETVEVLADAAEASENDTMREEAGKRAESVYETTGEDQDVLVSPVAFGQWKSYGFGEIKRRLEHGELLFPKEFGGRPVPNFALAMKLLKGHRTNEKDGKPAKKDDHPSDALMCAVLGWSRRWSAPRVQRVGGRR